ncbi:MAG: NTP transferase domain-containing protein [Actinomycetota bacterium]|nr:NTP transferase domain-containing protein [Actinomycetota bacterium]
MAVKTARTPRCALVVCGGAGSRLGAVGERINKAVLPRHGVPLVVATVRSIHRHLGCTTFHLLTGHLGQQVEEVVGRWIDDLDIRFVADAAPGGTAAAVLAALPSIGERAFVYSHANISLGDAAWAAIGAAVGMSDENDSLVAVSSAPIAPTHPHWERPGFAEPWYSVGLAIVRYCRVESTPEIAANAPFEDALGHVLALRRPPRTIDIGADWTHVENIDDVETMGLRAPSPKRHLPRVCAE